MKIGIHSWVLETKYDLIDALSIAKSIGYSGYEIDIGNFGGSGLGLQVLPDRMNQETRIKIKQAAQAANIEICSLCLGALWHYPLSENDEQYRNRGVEIVNAAIEFVSYLGAKGILLPLNQPKEVGNDDALKNIIKSLKSCVPFAERYGITLGVENVGSPFLSSARDLIKFINKFDSPFLKIYYDIANNLKIGLDPIMELTELTPYLFQVHLKNQVKDGLVAVDKNWFISCKDQENFQAAISTLIRMDFSGYLILEMPTLEQNSDLIAQKYFQLIKDFLVLNDTYSDV